MSTPTPIPPAPAPARRAGMPGLVAAALVGVHALGCAVLALVFPLVAAQGASLSSTSHVMFSLFTFMFAVGLGLLARGLLQGAAWPRTGTVVWLVLLLPVGWAMFQAGWVLLGVLLLGSALLGIVAVAAESRRAA